MVYTFAPEINWSAKLSLTPPKGWRFIRDLYGDRLHSNDEWEWRIVLPRYEDSGEWANGFFLVNLYLKESSRHTSLEAALAAKKAFDAPDRYPPQITCSEWKEF